MGLFHSHKWIKVSEVDHERCGNCYKGYGFCLYNIMVCTKCGKIKGGSSRGKFSEDHYPPQCKDQIEYMKNEFVKDKK